MLSTSGMVALVWEEPTGEGWTQIVELAIAVLLCTAIGLERQFRQKSAGLRTHALVGLGAALFVLVSKYGFTDVLEANRIVVDPSRVAAQIVSGIGFIGGGLIFVHRDTVRGLTTAATIWIAAAVGAACGAGLPLLGALATAAFFMVSLLYPLCERVVPRSASAISTVRIRYLDGRGLLRSILELATGKGFAVVEVATEPLHTEPLHAEPLHAEPSLPTGELTESIGLDRTGVGHAARSGSPQRVVEVTLRLRGAPSIQDFAVDLSDIDGVVSVNAGDEGEVGG